MPRYLHCGGQAQSGVTHSGSVQDLYRVSLQWQPPSNYTGQAVLRATVLQDYSTFWTLVTAPSVTVSRGEEPVGSARFVPRYRDVVTAEKIVWQGANTDPIKGRSTDDSSSDLDIHSYNEDMLEEESKLVEQRLSQATEVLRRKPPVTKMPWRSVLIGSKQQTKQPAELRDTRLWITEATTVSPYSWRDLQQEVSIAQEPASFKSLETVQEMSQMFEESQRWGQYEVATPRQDDTTAWRSVLLMPSDKKTVAPQRSKAKDEEKKERPERPIMNIRSREKNRKLPETKTDYGTKIKSTKGIEGRSYEEPHPFNSTHEHGEVQSRSGKLEVDPSYKKMESAYGGWDTKNKGSKLFEFESINFFLGIMLLFVYLEYVKTGER